MNPLRKLKHYVIGEALAAADDVFEKARIDLIYNITLFFLALGLAFYINLIANHYTWLVYVTSIGVFTLPMVLIVLKLTGNVRLAAYIFIAEQLVIGILNQFLRNFTFDIQGAFWTMVVILFAFFILGSRWGWGITIYSMLIIFFGLLNEQNGFAYVHFNIPPEQIPPVQPFFVFVPLMIVVYSVHRVVASRKIAEQQIQKQKVLLELNNKSLESKNEDIVSSINYARRIQYAVLPNEETIYRSIPLSCIVYKPRNIVSGDFFWFHEIDRDNYMIVCADCTGHGVPGAFMTVIGSNLLSQIVEDTGITSPGAILSELDKRITHTLKQEKERLGYVHDGMDLALLKVDKVKKEFHYTSAKRPAIFIRNKEIQEFKGSKNTLGGLRSGEKKFEEIKMNYQEDDIIYLFTDGYIDQFGGESNKKFMIKRFRELLLSIHQLPMHEQKHKLENTISSWIGNNEQTDDITVMGIRF